MLPNTIAVSSTLPRIKNKTYNENNENISYSKSVDFQKDRKSWPLAQVMECVDLETVSHISPLGSENETNAVDSINSSHNGCVTVLQTDNLQSESINELCLDGQPNNVLKIVLPLVSENVPLNSHPIAIEHNQFSQEESYVVSSNNDVQYSPKQCVDMPVYVNKYVNNRNHSLPEDSELNRFSSTFEDIKTLLKDGLVDGLDEMPPDFQPPHPPLLYKVSSLPNLLSYDSTKSHHSCSYLTMCGTKHELFMNKLCKNVVAKHDMSVQVSTELFKHQNQKIYVDTSCQTEDIFVNCQVNNEVLIQEIYQNDCHKNSNVSKKEPEINTNNEDEIKSNIEEDCNSLDYTNINVFNKKHERGTTVEKELSDISYTNSNVFNKELQTNTKIAENDCTDIGYTNINVVNSEYKIKTNEKEDCASYGYSEVNTFNKTNEVNANGEDCTSIGYININVYNKDNIITNNENCFNNVSYTKISTFNNKACEVKHNENFVNIDYTNMNVVENGNEVNANEEDNLKVDYTSINIFDKGLEEKTSGEDCVDIGYTNFSLYDKELNIDSNDDCGNYANANILEEFVNEQISLNNIDGDFDSFLFGPLPPSPIEEIVSELPILNGVETKRENSAPVPFVFDVYKNEPSTSIIKSRSIDAEFSHNFQQHQKIGTRSVQSERRTYPSEVPVSDGYPKPLMLKTSIHPTTIEKLSDISSSLPDTPLLGRCDFPRQYSATGTKTMTQMSNSRSINMRGAGHGSSIGLGQAMAGAELLHLNGPGRGWYPRQRQFRPVSVEQLDKLASKSPVGHSQWDSREGHKPVTLPPNLTPKFFHRSPREALRRVTSLLIRKGNTNKSNKSKTVFSSSVIGPHGDISEECVTSQSKRGFFKSLWRK
ncbi:PREDICTED: uncharacterized protein LOC107169564 [Diuraphis noxia]|uniref:uncharacterized protein LOC107169564 n=1 Tax=Diuraphis noxia TaxID=143948 RepID=UPI00076366FF|nr:PREDICTED: uncharacterized protein LOC107169564 [Diuraphis noxia]